MTGESICPYCGVGCRLRLEGHLVDSHQGKLLNLNTSSNNIIQISKIRGVETAPANLGKLCAKGAQLGPTIHSKDRLIHPYIRSSLTNPWNKVSWIQAIDHTVHRFQSIISKYGKDSVAFYGSGQLDTESVYVACKLFKGFIGTNNTDSNSRLCMATAVASYKTSLGADGPPPCYEDIDIAEVVLIIGSNMAEAHPVLFDRLRAAKKQNPNQFIVVVDPRKTQTTTIANLHVPIRAGGDIAFLNLIGKRLLQHKGVDFHFIANHTKGFENYLNFVMAQDESSLLSACGLNPEIIDQISSRIASNKKFLSFYCMGMNQSTVGMWKNNSLINLHLLTGTIGKPGAGPFSLTGQPNAMGGREAGMLATSLPGYRNIDDEKHRQEMEHYWHLPNGQISAKPGLTAIEMFQALESGRLKAIWIAATNPMVSLPDLHQVKRALQNAELVVVNDAYHPTETSRLAHVVLPAAQWGEKSWTSTNSERRVSFSPQLWPAPGEALPDWQILSLFAHKMGYTGFNYTSQEMIWEEFIRCTKNRPCNMAGMHHERLKDGASLQWPCPDSYHYGTKRLYEDGLFPTADGRANFLPREHRDPFEIPDVNFPFVLTTGRLYGHWHTLTRSSKSEKLMAREPEPFVEISNQDADILDIQENEWIEITSRRGFIRLKARIKPGLNKGTVFIPFHWGDLFGEGNALNYLTVQAIGKVAKQPEFKFCAVQLSKVSLIADLREETVSKEYSPKMTNQLSHTNKEISPAIPNSELKMEAIR